MNKKVCTLVLMFGFLLISGFAFSQDPTKFDATGENLDPTGSALLDQFRTSKNVLLWASSSKTTYAAISGHSQGDKQYGSASGDSKIYFQSKEEGVDLDATGLGASDSAAFETGWTAL
ncbi:MAG: hypothetical protein RBR03_03585 [Desulfuromonas thiophila]|nr:hypothetical protein [Desulfuromonas thiophila]